MKEGNGIRFDVVREIRDTPAIVHCASLAVASREEGAELVSVWYEGRYETAPDTTIRVSRRAIGRSAAAGGAGGEAPGGQELPPWSDAETAIHLPGVPLGNPVLWTEEKQLRLLFPVLLGESWTEGILCSASSADGGRSFSVPALFLARPGFMPKTRPLDTREGRFVLPIYHEASYAPYVALAPSVDAPQAVELVGETMARGKVIQPAIIERADGALLMLARSNQGTVWKSVSPNGGLSWSICRATALENPDGAVDLIKLRDGRVLLVWNNSRNSRSVLTAALSRDDGESWYAVRDIVRGAGEYAYPSACEAQDGTLCVAFTQDRYKIVEARFSAGWIEAGGTLESVLRTDPPQ